MSLKMPEPDQAVLARRAEIVRDLSVIVSGEGVIAAEREMRRQMGELDKLTRDQQALRDETIRNRRIPAGSMLMVVPWLLHRHRNLWDRPDHFIPERFLPENAGSRRTGASRLWLIEIHLDWRDGIQHLEATVIDRDSRDVAESFVIAPPGDLLRHTRDAEPACLV